MEWKRDKEAIYCIEIIPKNPNFKKITKIMNLTPYFQQTLGYFKMSLHHVQTAWQRFSHL